MPPFLNAYFEKDAEIKRLEAELEQLKTNNAKPDLDGTHQRRVRGAHFGGEPDPDTWRKINDLLRRERLDNTGLIEKLIDIEYANPTPPPPPGEPPERGEHFGCYPSESTWRKVKHLRRTHHMSNTELIAHLVGRAWSQ